MATNCLCPEASSTLSAATVRLPPPPPPLLGPMAEAARERERECRLCSEQNTSFCSYRNPYYYYFFKKNFRNSTSKPYPDVDKDVESEQHVEEEDD